MADVYETIQGNYFRTQTRYYANQAAIAVKNEDPATPSHQERAIFADKILNGVAPYYEMALSVGSNATIRSKIIADDPTYDDDMAFVVNSIYDAYAIQYPAQAEV